MAKVVFLIQMLPTFGGRCNRYFWDFRLKMLRLPIFNMLFQLVLTKFSKVNCFRVYQKLITWSSHAKSLLQHPYSVLLRSVLTDTHPPLERVATPLGSMSLTLLEQWFGFWFHVPLKEEPDKWKCFDTEHNVFHPYLRRLEKNNRLQRLLQRQHFLLSYLTTLSVGPAGGLNPWPITRQTSKWVSQLS